MQSGYFTDRQTKTITMKYILIIYLTIFLFYFKSITTFNFDNWGKQVYYGVRMPAKLKYHWMRITRKEILRNYNPEVTFCKIIDNSTHFVIDQFSAKTLAHVCNIY